MERSKLTNTLKIIEYREELKSQIRDINYAWLTEFFRVEEMDALMLSDPTKYIIEPGGYIFYAELNGEIVACAALMKVEDGVYELGKMGVYKEYRNLGIGTILLEYCLAFAERQKMNSLVLYSSRKLTNALHLYEKYGFLEVENIGGYYERGDIKMEKQIG